MKGLALMEARALPAMEHKMLWQCWKHALALDFTLRSKRHFGKFG